MLLLIVCVFAAFDEDSTIEVDSCLCELGVFRAPHSSVDFMLWLPMVAVVVMMFVVFVEIVVVLLYNHMWIIMLTCM